MRKQHQKDMPTNRTQFNNVFIYKNHNDNLDKTFSTNKQNLHKTSHIKAELKFYIYIIFIFVLS